MLIFYTSQSQLKKCNLSSLIQIVSSSFLITLIRKDVVNDDDNVVIPSRIKIFFFFLLVYEGNSGLLIC